MELRHLRYFEAVAEFGSFTAAGQRLRVSQSSISEQILDLENEIGGSLLDRSGRRVQLTPQGRVFLEEARKTLEAANRAVERTQRSLRGEIGTLSIGFFLWGAGGFFPRIIREYRSRHPGIRLSLIDMHTREQTEALENGRIDVGLTRPLEPPYDRILRSELLYRDPIVVAVPSDHKLAGKEFPLSELRHERLVLHNRRTNALLYDSIVTMCTAAGFSPNIVNTSDTWSGILTLVEAGEGIALVPSGARHLQTRILDFSTLVPNTLSLGVSVAWNPRNEGPALNEFLALLRENHKRISSTGT
ncbi:MAG TPA: LysR family transcriptional regulator [Acidobacteriaceae bacterium]